MKIQNPRSRALPRRTLSLGLVMLMGGASLAAGAKKETEDRKLAQLLAERMGVVAAEGQRFAAGRDALAQARLATSQRLAENLVSLEEQRALDLRAWEVIGATSRLGLFEAVVTTSDEIVAQHQSRAERRREQERQLAETRSGVELQAAKLRAAARSMAALAEPPERSDAAELLNSLALALSGATGAAADKTDGGLALVEKLAEKALSQALGDKAIPKPKPD